MSNDYNLIPTFINGGETYCVFYVKQVSATQCDIKGYRYDGVGPDATRIEIEATGADLGAALVAATMV